MFIKRTILFLCAMLSFLFNAYSGELEDRLDMLQPKEDVIPKFFQDIFEAKRSVPSTEEEQLHEAVPDVVDLRWRDTEVQKQVGGTCTAFGLVASMENLLLGKVKLSENHLWSLYRQYQPVPAINAASRNAITYQQYWPINSRRPDPKYLDNAHYYLKSVKYLEDDLQRAMQALASDKVVYLAFFVTQGVVQCEAKPDRNSPLVNGGHAVEVVGYDKPDQRLIIKNSWGKSCGDAGYQYLPFEYCKRPGMYCMMWSIEEVGEK